MNFFQAFALLISLTALFAYLNARFIKLPAPVGSLLVALVLSLGVVLFGSTALEGSAEALLQRLDFDVLVLQGLLVAGSRIFGMTESLSVNFRHSLD